MRNWWFQFLVQLVASLFVFLSLGKSQSSPDHSSDAAGAGARPLMLEKNQGELRTRRPRPLPTPASQFMLKVGPKINGSQRLIVGTEEIAPGASIPIHKHLAEDEILLVHSGVARVLLGNQSRDLHAGGLVFIPANTWIGLKNTSAQAASITFIFSAPGFDDFQRCISVPAGEKPTHMTQEEWQRCQQQGHAVYKGVDEDRK